MEIRYDGTFAVFQRSETGKPAGLTRELCFLFHLMQLLQIKEGRSTPAAARPHRPPTQLHLSKLLMRDTLSPP